PEAGRRQLVQPFWRAAGMGCATMCCIYSLCAAVMVLVGRGSLTINYARLPPTLAFLTSLAVGTLSGAIALAIRREKPWSRDVILLFWLALGSANIIGTSIRSGLTAELIWAGI